MKLQTIPDHKIQRMFKIAKTRLYPFFRHPRDMMTLRNQREWRIQLAAIAVGQMSKIEMLQELSAVPEYKRRSGFITYRQLWIARHLWNVSEYEAERRLNNGELPDGPEIKTSV